MAAGGLFDQPELAAFYDLSGGVRQDFRFCEALAEGAGAILDLGCGTGDLAVRLAATSHVTAVDPAGAMLDIARAKPGADAVDWIEADARYLELNRQFDLVVLTGHAFQVFLADQDQRDLLQTIRRHLAPDGRFLFDTRNPDHPGRKERGRAETFQLIDHPDLGAVEKWNVSRYDQDACILTYSNSYRIVSTGVVHTARERIRYTRQADLATMIAEAGLRVDRWLGDWQGRPFEPHSAEIIPLGGAL